jgi:hypothetical protein
MPIDPETATSPALPAAPRAGCLAAARRMALPLGAVTGSTDQYRPGAAYRSYAYPNGVGPAGFLPVAIARSLPALIRSARCRFSSAAKNAAGPRTGRR